MDKKFENRKIVSRLIMRVLTDNLCVREALLMFPDDTDTSVKSAYHALVHREADEDLRHRDLLYKDEQDNYLEFVAETLKSGKDLPENVIKNYNKYYKEATITHSKGMKGIFKSLCRFLNV